MKGLFNIIIIMSLAFFIAACEKEINPERLKYQDGKYYETGYNKPFTGKTVDYYTKKIKKSETNYIDGIKQGKFFEWHDNGQLKKEGQFINGNLDGKITEWYKNGQTAKIENFNNGRKDGEFAAWYETGSNKYKLIYEFNISYLIILSFLMPVANFSFYVII